MFMFGIYTGGLFSCHRLSGAVILRVRSCCGFPSDHVPIAKGGPHKGARAIKLPSIVNRVALIAAFGFNALAVRHLLWLMEDRNLRRARQ